MPAALEQPKKPAGGGFGQFMAQKRPEFIKQCAGQPISAVAKLGGAKWKALSEAARAPYNKAFEEAKIKYAADMEAYLAAGGVKQKGAAALRAEKRKAKEGKLKKAKDPNAPKRPAGGAFGCFLAANRAAFQKACPGAVTGVAKLASEKWKALPTAQREKYEKEYAAKAAAYQEAMKSYTPPPKEEDDEEEGEEGEEDEEEDEEEDGEEAESAEEAAEPPPAKKPKATQAKTADTTDVMAQAKKEKMHVKLQTIMDRPEIVAKKIDAGVILKALHDAGGKVPAAKRALLGA